MLLKGASGTGKTYQYRKLVEGGMKGLYACVNEHTGTIDDLDPDTWMLRKLDIPLAPREKQPANQDFIMLCDYLRSDQHDYEFLFIDSLMNYADELESWLKHVQGKTGFEMWGLYGEKMKMMLKLLVSLTNPTLPKPVHVIGTWGVEVDQDWEGKRAVTPVMSGKMVKPRIDYYFDDVFYLERRLDAKGELQYVLNTRSTHEFAAKVSAGNTALPAAIANPDMYKILQLLQTEQTDQTEKA